MAIIKCKMCGGDLTISPNTTICECEYCGSKQTIPNTDDEKRLKLYERANKLRFECEFDKAAGVYESIVAEFQSEAEAYWGLILCKYGIEYVDDPKTGKKIPTCHRSSFDSVFDDDNFERVMENADSVAVDLYRTEAKQIEELRKGILAVSSKEEPYDIFICYKETDENGDRTVDSVLAQKVFTELESNGYRVFFSRISLEDKLGREYEPFIFSALNSAKVMLAFGTSYKNYNAVWVKNEWGRFLQLMEEDSSKILIPCFKDIDAYDMPKEFTVLQAQDMGKVGAIQDLLRGIDKVFGRDRTRTESREYSGVLNNDGNSIIKRGYFALEDREWDKAVNYFDQALNQDAENAEIHLGLFLANRNCVDINEFYEKKIKDLETIPGKIIFACPTNDEKINKIIEENYVSGYLNKNAISNQFQYNLSYESFVDGLENEKSVFEDKDWKKAERFAEGEFRERIIDLKQSVISEIDKRIEKEKKESDVKAERIKTEYTVFIENTEKKIIEQRFQAESKKEQYYQYLCSEIDKTDSERRIRELIDGFGMLGSYKESNAKIDLCRQKLDNIRKANQRKEEERRIAQKRRINKICIIVAAIALLLVVGYIGYKVYQKKVVVPSQNYEAACRLMDSGKYEEAIKVFSELGDYKDSKTKIEKCNEEIFNIDNAVDQGTYQLIKTYVDENDFDSAIENLEFLRLDDNRDDAVDYMIEKLISEYTGFTEMTVKENEVIQDNCFKVIEVANDNQKDTLIGAMVDALITEYESIPIWHVNIGFVNGDCFEVMEVANDDQKSKLIDAHDDSMLECALAEKTMIMFKYSSGRLVDGYPTIDNSAEWFDLMFNKDDYTEDIDKLYDYADVVVKASKTLYFGKDLDDTQSIFTGLYGVKYDNEEKCLALAGYGGDDFPKYYIISGDSNSVVVGTEPNKGEYKIQTTGAVEVLSEPLEQEADKLFVKDE